MNKGSNGRAGGGGGGGRGAADKSDKQDKAGSEQDGEMKANKNGDTHCFHCGLEGHWVHECPKVEKEQQAQLNMHLAEQGGGQDGGEAPREGKMQLNVDMLQDSGLTKTRAYLDNCSTVTGMTDAKYNVGLHASKAGMRVSCNAGSVLNKQVGKMGNLEAWHMPDGIANIISMPELEKLHRITYDSWEGHYTVHTPSGPVKFHKDEHGLPYVELEGPGKT